MLRLALSPRVSVKSFSARRLYWHFKGFHLFAYFPYRMQIIPEHSRIFFTAAAHFFLFFQERQIVFDCMEESTRLLGQESEPDCPLRRTWFLTSWMAGNSGGKQDGVTYGYRMHKRSYKSKADTITKCLTETTYLELTSAAMWIISRIRTFFKKKNKVWEKWSSSNSTSMHGSQFQFQWLTRLEFQFPQRGRKCSWS